jgi:thiol-disulfide isomerase/thioredoxin
MWKVQGIALLVLAAAGLSVAQEDSRNRGRKTDATQTTPPPAPPAPGPGEADNQKGPAAPRPPAFGMEGQPAPAFQVAHWIDKNGEARKPVKLSDFKGKLVYLYCFQSWCPGCHSHGFPTLKKVSEAFKGDDRVAFAAVQTVFEGFATNTKDKLRTIQKRYGLSVPFGHDAGPDSDQKKRGAGSAFMKRYRTRGTPWTIIIDPSGRVLANGFRLDGDKLIAYFRERLKTMPKR